MLLSVVIVPLFFLSSFKSWSSALCPIQLSSNKHGSESGSHLAVFVWVFVTPWTGLFMKFSRQEYWSGLPYPSPGDLPYPGIKPRSPVSQILYNLSYPGSQSRHRILKHKRILKQKKKINIKIQCMLMILPSKCRRLIFNFFFSPLHVSPNIEIQPLRY